MFVCVIAERMGGASDEDSEGPLSAPAGASGNHDERFRPYTSCCREVYQERNGSVRQQHHLCPLPVSQSAGATCGPLSSCLSEATRLWPLFLNVVKFSMSDCQYTGQSCCHAEQEVRKRSLLHEHAEHCTAGSEVSQSFKQPTCVRKHNHKRTG